MAVHDAYARLTPFELALPGEGFAQERFPLIEKEAGMRGSSLSDPGSFALLSEAGLILREIRGEGEAPGLIGQHGALLFHAFHFWKEGRPLFLLEAPLVRQLAATGPEEGSWETRLPARAGYLQLPQHLAWAPGSPPESLDGVFWSAPDPESFSLLLVLGIRKDRPGLSVVPLPTLPLQAAAPWASLQLREGGEDFSCDLPGAGLEGLLGVESGAEALKLAMRAFWYMEAYPGSVGEEARAGGVGARAVAGPREGAPAAVGSGKGASLPGPAAGDRPPPAPTPSALPYRRVVLVEGG